MEVTVHNVVYTINEEVTKIDVVSESNIINVLQNNEKIETVELGRIVERIILRDTATIEYPINVPSTLWVITHNLNRYPSVTIIDSSGNEMFGSITHISKNIMHAEFSAAFSGIAYLI